MRHASWSHDTLPCQPLHLHITQICPRSHSRSHLCSHPRAHACATPCPLCLHVLLCLCPKLSLGQEKCAKEAYQIGREPEALPMAKYPWENVTTSDLMRVFREESWGGTLVLSEFEGVLTKLGLGGLGIERPLFGAFDQDGNGQLDLREMFVGLALLLSSSQEARLECAFMLLDANGSGMVSLDEVTLFLSTVAPRPANHHEASTLASKVMQEADTNYSGLISFEEFMAWPGKQTVLDSIDEYHIRVLSRFDGLGDVPAAASTSAHRDTEQDEPSPMDGSDDMDGNMEVVQ